MPGAISPWEIKVPRDAIITRSPPWPMTQRSAP